MGPTPVYGARAEKPLQNADFAMKQNMSPSGDIMRAATVVQQLCKPCTTCFKFYCMFYFTCDRSL